MTYPAMDFGMTAPSPLIWCGAGWVSPRPPVVGDFHLDVDNHALYCYAGAAGWLEVGHGPQDDERRQLGNERARRQTAAIDWDRLRSAAYRSCTVPADPTAILETA